MQGDGNRLVECQECHGLYHQECHQPPINEAEIPLNDPRLAWYCADCKKKLNKAVCGALILQSEFSRNWRNTNLILRGIQLDLM